MDAGELAGIGTNGVIVTEDALASFAKADGVLDFTVPAASVTFAGLAAQARIVHVIGTTGCSDEDEARFHSRRPPCSHRQVGQYEPWGEFACSSCSAGRAGAGRW